MKNRTSNIRMNTFQKKIIREGKIIKAVIKAATSKILKNRLKARTNSKFPGLALFLPKRIAVYLRNKTTLTKHIVIQRLNKIIITSVKLIECIILIMNEKIVNKIHAYLRGRLKN